MASGNGDGAWLAGWLAANSSNPPIRRHCGESAIVRAVYI